MDGFTLVDAIVAGVIIISALLAFARGFVREVMSILGWIIAAVVAYALAAQIDPLVKELPVIGDFLASSCELSMIASFMVVFAVALVVVSVFTPLFSGLIRRTALSGVDQGFGFLFGALRGILLVAIALIVYDRVMVNEAIAIVDDSRSAQVFGRFSQSLEDQIPEDSIGWIRDRYEDLVSVCETP